LNYDIGTSDLERSRLPDLVAELEGAFGNQVSVGGRESSSMKSLGNWSKRLRNPESMFEVVVSLQLYVVELKWSSKLFVVVCLPRARESS
jgi:hypothetical protein